MATVEALVTTTCRRAQIVLCKKDLLRQTSFSATKHNGAHPHQNTLQRREQKLAGVVEGRAQVIFVLFLEESRPCCENAAESEDEDDASD